MKEFRVTIDEVKECLKHGETVFFIDARTPADWEQADTKVRGALRVPAGEVEKHLDGIPRDCAVVAYGTGPNDESSARVALILKEHGWNDVHHLFGGFNAWLKAGLPVERKGLPCNGKWGGKWVHDEAGERVAPLFDGKPTPSFYEVIFGGRTKH